MSETSHKEAQWTDGGASNGKVAEGPVSVEAEAKGGAEAAAPSKDEQIAKLNDEKREIGDRMMRIAADFENYKKRARKEMEDAGTRGMESLLKELLPVLDNLDRALTAASQKGDNGDPLLAALLEGVRLVQKQFLASLERFQIKPFEAQGKPFDPQFHEAVQQIDSDTLPPGTVATVFQRGYLQGSRLLRPAMVAVVKGRAGQAAEGMEDPGQGGQGEQGADRAPSTVN